ncbi:hypothetical protein AK812_SmicGene1961 [Symbiodinium microadriaticum]|uniref:Uncharacterized protein n=1 Tax=Symbiodinium microadriaticum TaxID=2951 RepID=A0A1Q9F2R4_SYMMI|nr:hypothetical protein AK812_SmicGene1961 [Symbiodinium microadriaticum]
MLPEARAADQGGQRRDEMPGGGKLPIRGGGGKLPIRGGDISNDCCAAAHLASQTALLSPFAVDVCHRQTARQVSDRLARSFAGKETRRHDVGQTDCAAGMSDRHHIKFTGQFWVRPIEALCRHARRPGIPGMMRPVPIVMPELKQRKQEEKKVLGREGCQFFKDDLGENGRAMLASPGCLLTWKPAVGPAFCLFDAKLHHQHVRQRTRINGKDTPAVQGLPTMMRPVPIVMPELKQRKQKLGKATGSRNDDSVSRRCHRCILLGQGPCALAKCFASTETRRHDVGRAASAQSSPSRSGLLCLHWRRTTVFWCLDKKFPGLADKGPASRMPVAEAHQSAVASML